MKYAYYALIASLLVPMHVFGEKTVSVDSDLQHRFQLLHTITRKFNTKWHQYTKCMQGNCSPEERQERWEEVKSATWTTVKIGVALILIVAGTRKIVRKIQQKRRTLKIE